MATVPNYTYRTFWWEEDGEYVAECDEIPGLSALAPTPEAAITELKEAILAYFETLDEQGMAHPEPIRHSRAA
jgi:predicted RNase H-like HicB family nuclease